MTPSEFPVFHDILLHFQTQHFQQVKAASLSESQRDLQRLDRDITSEWTRLESLIQSDVLVNLLIEFRLHIIKFSYHTLKYIIFIFRDSYIMFFKKSLHSRKEGLSHFGLETMFDKPIRSRSSTLQRRTQDTNRHARSGTFQTLTKASSSFCSYWTSRAL